MGDGRYPEGVFLLRIIPLGHRLYLLFLLTLASLASGQSYVLVDCGLLNPVGESRSGGLNNLGHVTGTGTAPNGLSEHAFFFDGAIQDLGTLGMTYSWGHAVNARDRVVGYSGVASVVIHAYAWSSGTMFDEHVGELSFSRANGLNQRGDVAGVTAIPAPFVNEYRGYVLAEGVGTILDTLGGTESQAFDVNDKGQVVGFARTKEGKVRAVLWDGAVPVELGDLGDAFSRAKALNNTPTIVGQSRILSGDYRGFVWSEGVMVDFGTLGGLESDARAVNAFGKVVGAADQADGTSRAVLWEEGVLTDLNTLVAGAQGWVLTGANGINELGQISGTGKIDGVRHAYRLDPVLDAPVISGLVPGMAGRRNEIHALGATPGQHLWFLMAKQQGTTPIPGCPGLNLSLDKPRLLGIAPVDRSGRALLMVPLPAVARGLDLYFQAFDPASCKVSGIVEQEIF